MSEDLPVPTGPATPRRKGRNGRGGCSAAASFEQAPARLVTETSLGTEAVDSGMEESPVVGGVALLPRLELRCGQGREALDAADSDRHLDGRGDVVGRTE